MARWVSWDLSVADPFSCRCSARARSEIRISRLFLFIGFRRNNETGLVSLVELGLEPKTQKPRLPFAVFGMPLNPT